MDLSSSAVEGRGADPGAEGNTGIGKCLEESYCNELARFVKRAKKSHAKHKTLFSLGLGGFCAISP
jgi:hypothetical protein